MAKIDQKLSEETGLLVEIEEGVESTQRRPSEETVAESARKGGQQMEPERPHDEGRRTEEECEQMDLNKKQSIDELSCGRIKKTD